MWSVRRQGGLTKFSCRWSGRNVPRISTYFETVSFSLSLSLSFTPWYPLCLAHLPSSSIASTEAPFPRASVPLSSLFFSRYPCLSFFYVGLSFSYSSSESSTQPLRGASRRSRVSARAFRLAVQRILG